MLHQWTQSQSMILIFNNVILALARFVSSKNNMWRICDLVNSTDTCGSKWASEYYSWLPSTGWQFGRNLDSFEYLDRIWKESVGHIQKLQIHASVSSQIHVLMFGKKLLHLKICFLSLEHISFQVLLQSAKKWSVHHNSMHLVWSVIR